MMFDSQLPLGEQFKNKIQRTTKKTDDELLAEAAMPPMELIHSISQSLSVTLGLTLFGYDLITQVETGHHAVIDVNYCPSYTGVANFDKILLDFLLKQVKQRRKS